MLIMNKRLSKSEYVLTFLILFVIIGSLSAFFYGVKIGKDKTTVKYEQLIAEKQELSKDLTAYHQQYLVSFYHTIYSPYRDFQKKWFSRMESIELQGNSIDAEDVFKELSKIADEKFASMQSMTMPTSSPLLQQAHDNYLKSLKLYSEATTRFRAQVGSKSSEQLVTAISNDAYFVEAERFGLVAQAEFYSAISLWNASINPALSGTELPAKSDLTFHEWSELNLNLKNEFVAHILSANQYYEMFSPQDITIRIDEMILDGYVSKQNATTIKPVIEMLVDTGAVRSGDYLKRRAKFYMNETLPQLPFFYE
jgi:hypothetical protein